ncbi:ABC transporter ATP-binding protein [Salimicrobium halophilum]|uniref:ABC-2 type transport system ATP-binding protein n=1 Tax=Salimicrobium halophilum TaxID=86666 RepID=A0A1G8TNC3_9BACI|nr:ABC transporter ATP-binding protein [Salimicrobium halophilum]SDJ42903.1 ABC-2 type transport system ATP-binding protein [Salimicrobium halophilum]
MLKLENVTKKFGDFTAVDDLSLEIPEKQMFGFLGANGAGKTTTFRMVLGLLDQTGGEISWNNGKIGYGESHLVGYLPEERGLYPKLKVEDQLVYLAKLRGMKKSESVPEIEKWLNRFKVPEYRSKKIEELSKGNQQKIQFISAVLHKPKLLILDEPFSGLDPVNVEMLKEAVVELKEAGTSIVFSSHRMEHVEELCESLCIMHKGRPVLHGNLRDIKRSFGKKNVRIDADFDLGFLEEKEEVIHYKHTAEGAMCQVREEKDAQVLFEALQGRGFVRRFVLEEPSLEEIFIEKVGESYE